LLCGCSKLLLLHNNRCLLLLVLRNGELFLHHHCRRLMLRLGLLQSSQLFLQLGSLLRCHSLLQGC